MQGNQAKIKQVPSQSKQDLGLNAGQTQPQLNSTLAKVNKTWDKCKATKPNLNRTLPKINKTWA